MSDQQWQTADSIDLEHASLERPTSFDLDWGGDGSDPTRAVRAHVLAALRPETEPYLPPLDQVLEFGDIPAEELQQWAISVGIGQEHIPELLRMARDRRLATIEADIPAAWAMVHAFDLLKNFDLAPYVADLLPIFDIDFDRLNDDLIGMLAEVGPVALPELVVYLQDYSRWVWGRTRVANILQQIAERNPAVRQEVVSLLSGMLSDPLSDHEVVITGVMGALLELKATETIPLIRRAFELEKIDESMYGSWEHVLEEFGVAADADDPLIKASRQRHQQRRDKLLPPDLRTYVERQQSKELPLAQHAASGKRKQDKARKQKNKHKSASASRKANRKKRK
jgi:hypothetical protein